MKHAPLAAVVLALSSQGATAATLGLPIFTTAPTTIAITNQFDGSQPTPSYTMSLHTTIASAQGAPDLVGQSIDFSWYFDGGFDDGTITSSLSIGGMSILADPLDKQNQLSVSLPFVETLDPLGGPSTFNYTGIFAGFGPRVGPFAEVTLQFTLNAVLPMLDGYLYCETAGPFCEFSNIAGLTDIGGHPVSVVDTFHYPEGVIRDATVTFATVDGRAVAPVPLPAGGFLLLGALFGLAGFRRRVSA